MTDNNQQPTTPPAGDTGTQPGGAQPNQATTPERTFTQADIDRIVTERLSRQEQSIKAQFADYSALKEKASKWETHEDSQKTELQRIQDQAKADTKALQDQLDALAKERETLSATARTATTQAAIMAAASAAGIVGTQLVATVKLVDVSQLEFDDKGEVKNAADVVAKVVEEYPFLKTPESSQQAQQPKPNAKISPTNPAGTNPATETDEQRYRRVRYGSVNQTFGDGGVTPPQEKG
jgi:hypothetical protein